MKVWPNTDLFCGGSHGIPLEERLRVKRPYGRVDRVVCCVCRYVLTWTRIVRYTL